MGRLAREGARNRVVQFWNDVPFEDLDATIRAAFRYRPEYEEIIRAPSFMAIQYTYEGVLEGDCDDIATFYAAVLRARSLPVRLVAVRTSAETWEFDHVYAEYMAMGRWHAVDPTVDLSTIQTYPSMTWDTIVEYL